VESVTVESVPRSSPEPDHHLVARYCRGQNTFSGCPFLFTNRQRGRQYDGGGMHKGFGMGVIEIEGVNEYAVRQSS
jgi:hypothetical protein